MASDESFQFTFRFVNGQETMAVGIALPCVCIFIVVLRFWTRSIQKVNIGLDDWLIMGCLVSRSRAGFDARALVNWSFAASLRSLGWVHASLMVCTRKISCLDVPYKLWAFQLYNLRRTLARWTPLFCGSYHRAGAKGYIGNTHSSYVSWRSWLYSLNFSVQSAINSVRSAYSLNSLSSAQRSIKASHDNSKIPLKSNPYMDVESNISRTSQAKIYV